MSRVYEAWRRSQMPGDGAAAPPSADSPDVASADEATTFVEAAEPGGTKQPTAFFPIRESAPAIDAAAPLEAAAERLPALADAQNRRNQTFEELIRDIARDEERLNITSRATPAGASLLSRA